MLAVVELLLRGMQARFQKTGKAASWGTLFTQCVWGTFSALFLAGVVGTLTTGRFSGQRFAEGLFFEGGLFVFLAARKIRTENTIHHAKESSSPVSLLLPIRFRMAFVIQVLFAVSWITIGIYSLYYEPWNLQVKTYTIESDRIAEPIRIVLMTDPQSDNVGEYELRAFELTKSQNADLILFGGDYLQYDRGNRGGEYGDLNQLLMKVGFDAPLGVYAVNGNVDSYERWSESFEGTGIEAIMASHSKLLQKGETTIALTMLTIDDCRRLDAKKIIAQKYGEMMSQQETSPKDTFHVVLGHDPTLVYNGTGADLVLAGHTHGGQCCVPGWGPVYTSARRIPLAWSLGKHFLPDGATLIVSNGVGMERSVAPRIRFWCPPQIVVVELLPAQRK